MAGMMGFALLNQSYSLARDMIPIRRPSFE
jgi:hypothetical protein